MKQLVLDRVTSTHSQRPYEVALDGFLTWWEDTGGPAFTKATVQSFRRAGGGWIISDHHQRAALGDPQARGRGADNNLLDPALAAGIGRVWGEGLTEKVIWQVLDHYADVAGMPGLAPHNMRRTCTKLCRAVGGDLEQIQPAPRARLGADTERYLGTKQNLVDAPNDHIGLEMGAE